MSETVGISSTYPVRQWPFVQRTRPQFEISDSDRPAVAYKPDRSLPVVFMDLELRDWIVIAKGTVVAVNAAGDLVPANGGSAQTYTYTVNDQAAGVIDQNGNLAVAGSTYTNASNIPVGVAPADFFQDISNRYNNYKMNTIALGILCERTVEVPYFSWVDLGSPVNLAAAQALVQTKIGGVAYDSSAAASNALFNGCMVKSDPNGKYVPWIVGTDTDVTQIVGQVLLVDSTFPKDLLNFVQTYPFSEMAGSETGGFPGHLADVGAIRAARIRLKF